MYTGLVTIKNYLNNKSLLSRYCEYQELITGEIDDDDDFRFSTCDSCPHLALNTGYCMYRFIVSHFK